MFKSMSWQQADASVWKQTSPVIEMASVRSPAFDAVRQLGQIMGHDGQLRLSGARLADLARGWVEKLK